MVQQKIANMLSETVYTGITNLYIITKKSTKHKIIHRSNKLLFESVYAIAAAKLMC